MGAATIPGAGDGGGREVGPRTEKKALEGFEVAGEVLTPDGREGTATGDGFEGGPERGGEWWSAGVLEFCAHVFPSIFADSVGHSLSMLEKEQIKGDGRLEIEDS